MVGWWGRGQEEDDWRPLPLPPPVPSVFGPDTYL